MQVSHKTTVLVALGSLASLASTVSPTIHPVAIPAKAKASKRAKQISPRRQVTLALDAMRAAFDKWAWAEIVACCETLDAWSNGDIADEDIDLQELENWRFELSNKGNIAWRTFIEEEPETFNAYAKASEQWAACKQAKQTGGVR